MKEEEEEEELHVVLQQRMHLALERSEPEDPANLALVGRHGS